MKTFDFVEDYITYIGGLGGHGSPVSTVSLARYDRAPVNSFLTQILNSVPFTDRQAELALRIVGKYERQLRMQGIGLGTILETPKYKYGLRTVDRTQSIKLVDGHIQVKFPFNGTLIQTLRDFSNGGSEGYVRYQQNEKVWNLALTESCLNFAVTLGKENNFEIDPELEDMFNRVLESEAVPYRIELRRAGDGYEITNAAPSMVEYIEQRLGGFGADNLLALIDHAPVLGYSVSPELIDSLEFKGFALNQEIRIQTLDRGLKDLADYAKTYNRYPIVSYRVGPKVNDGGLEHHFDPSEVLYLTHRNETVPEDTSKYKLVIIGGAAAASWTKPVPILVLYSNMVFGAERSWLLQNAHKVCYYCDAFYKDNTNCTVT